MFEAFRKSSGTPLRAVALATALSTMFMPAAVSAQQSTNFSPANGNTITATKAPPPPLTTAATSATSSPVKESTASRASNYAKENRIITAEVAKGSDIEIDSETKLPITHKDIALSVAAHLRTIYPDRPVKILPGTTTGRKSFVTFYSIDGTYVGTYPMDEAEIAFGMRQAVTNSDAIVSAPKTMTQALRPPSQENE